ncbi:MAG TPA: hypothetical protein ENO28_10030 [Bacteroidetes bacterium]|nr:hypothetical protein [Bacteroidota bacterium]
MNRREFTRLTSLAALILPRQKDWGLITDVNQLHPNAVKKQCIAAFKRFEQVWNFNDFWKRGNTFDACLVFADALHKKWPADKDVIAVLKSIDSMLEENYRYFKSFDAGKMWADDFGWWGLMAINARKHLLRSGNEVLADKYTKLSIELCWQQEKEHAYDFSDTAKPVPHGCRNGDADGQDKGVKNTVTNVLFFLLSCRIYRLLSTEKQTGNEQYLEMAYHQWLWFDSWFKLTGYDYLQQLGNDAVLVMERPTAFFDGSDYKNTTHPTWEKGWLWTGDQGMLMAALTELLNIKNDIAAWIMRNHADTGFNSAVFENSINHYIKSLAKGVNLGLIGNTDNIIREAPFKANFGPEFGNDYLAGRGILMRYMGQLGNKAGGVNFKKCITATAAAIWHTRDVVTNQFSPEFTSNESDELYAQQYRKLTGLGDPAMKWQIQAMNEQQKFGVCQSIGLDAFGALINQL